MYESHHEKLCLLKHIYKPEARHFFEGHFVYYDTPSKVLVELPVRRIVCSSNTFSSKSHLVEYFPELSSSQISRRRHVVCYDHMISINSCLKPF